MDIQSADAYQKHANRAYQLMAKPTGPSCNLDCNYCYYLEKEKLYRNSRKIRVLYKALENFIKQYITIQELPVYGKVFGEVKEMQLQWQKEAMRV